MFFTCSVAFSRKFYLFADFLEFTGVNIFQFYEFSSLKTFSDIRLLVFRMMKDIFLVIHSGKLPWIFLWSFSIDEIFSYANHKRLAPQILQFTRQTLTRRKKKRKKLFKIETTEKESFSCWKIFSMEKKTGRKLFDK